MKIRIVEIAILLLSSLILLTALRNTAGESDIKGKEQLETALRRSVMACYAAEGVYPPGVDYLKEHYGLIINDDKYSVHYDAFAENLMPEITVIELN